MAKYRNIPSTIEQWLSLFRQFIGDRNLDSEFIGDQYFQMIANNIDNLSADEICNQIIKACEDFYGRDKEGRKTIGKDKEETSVMLCKENEYPAYLRFIDRGIYVADMGISTVGSLKYQFYRNADCNIQYHNQRFGGTMRRWRTPYSDEKFFNPDGSRDWGRGLRDLWESIKNG